MVWAVLCRASSLVIVVICCDDLSAIATPLSLSCYKTHSVIGIFWERRRYRYGKEGCHFALPCGEVKGGGE